MGKWSKYGKKYKKEWENEEDLKTWIVEVEGDNSKAACRFCNSVIRAHHSDLITHANTVKHKNNSDPLTGSGHVLTGRTVKMECVKYRRSIKNKMATAATALKNSPKKSDVVTVTVGLKTDIETGSTNFSSEHGQDEMVNPASLGFIGSGSMAQALLTAFLKEGLVDPQLTIVSAPSDRNLSKLRNMGVKTTHDNNEVVRQSDLVFVCVKSHVINSMIEELQALDSDHSPLFVSVVTEVDIMTLEEMLSTVVVQPRVVRCMPNNPATVGQGCCVYTRGTNTSASDAEVMNSMLSAMGLCAEIPEYQMDAAFGLAGSGPAYIYTAIEALADGGVKMGLPRQLAQTLAAQMVKGAATMVLETGKHPAQLKDEVCSPGGTTITALHTLERYAFRNALISAVEASAMHSTDYSSRK